MNPGILSAPTGPQFYTPPDGTIVYRNDGTPVDLTGQKLTVSPNRFGSNAKISLYDGSIPPLPAGQVLITGLRNITPDLVGAAAILIANAGSTRNQLSGPKFGDISNDGFFIIQARGTGYATEDESVIISNPSAADPDWTAGTYPGGVAPDINNGNIKWSILYGLDFAPLFSEGQPLAELARRGTPLTVTAEQTGPMTFSDYDPTVPPVTVNDEGGLFSKIQRM